MIDLLKPEVTVEPRPADPDMSRYVRSYLIMRICIGALAVALPFLLVLIDGLGFDGDPFPRDSLSAYYYSGVRELFVGTLSATAVFLVTYKVADRTLDNTLSVVAGFAVLLVMLFPDLSARRRRPDTASGAVRGVRSESGALRRRGRVHRLARRDQLLLRRAGRRPSTSGRTALTDVLAWLSLVLCRRHRGGRGVDRRHGARWRAEQGTAHRRGRGGLGVRGVVADEGLGARLPPTEVALHSEAGPPSTSGPGHSPFKAVARVRIPLGASSHGPVAQLVEQGTFNPKVVGSIPTRPIKEIPANRPSSSPAHARNLSDGSTGSAPSHHTVAEMAGEPCDLSTRSRVHASRTYV